MNHPLSNVVKTFGALANVLYLTWIGTAQGALFTGLGDLPGGEIQSGFIDAYRGMGAFGTVLISRDGSVAVGSSSSEGSQDAPETFRWTQALGIKGIGSLPVTGDLHFSSSPGGVSADGSVIVGRSLCCNDPNLGTTVQEAFRWTEETGMEGLGWLPGFDPTISRSRALDVSNDGSVIVGSTAEYVDDFIATTVSAFRWTREDGMVELTVPPGFEGASTQFEFCRFQEPN